MSWLICIPVWGDHHLRLFETETVPALRVALAVGGISDVRFLVHTDNPLRVNLALEGFAADVRSPHKFYSPYRIMSAAHRDALAAALPGERVAFVNADMVGSCEVFAAAERRFAEGKQAIMVTGTRTALGGERPPCGAQARDLLAWAWEHRHPWTEDCVWGRGKSVVPSQLHFESGNSVITHAFHLHPWAVVASAKLRIDGLTIDDTLADSIALGCIHVVTDPDEAAFIEMSPPERPKFHRHQSPSTARSIAYWARGLNETNGPRCSALHRWQFQHRIVIKGDGADRSDVDVCNEIELLIAGPRLA